MRNNQHEFFGAATIIQSHFAVAESVCLGTFLPVAYGDREYANVGDVVFCLGRGIHTNHSNSVTVITKNGYVGWLFREELLLF